MAAQLDNVGFVAVSAGTVDFVFSTVLAGGYQSPSAGGAVNGKAYKYFAFNADKSVWEIGESNPYNSGSGTFPRSTVLFNSSGTGTAAGQSGAGTKMNFASAPNVVIVALKED